MVMNEENNTGGTSTGLTTTIDANHPLFLQGCDTPGSSLISFQLTGPENYALWSRSMRIGLLGKSKMGLVDGRHTKDKFPPSLHDLWEKVNAIVLSWIMSSVSKELISCVAYASSACTVWSDLKERFDKENGSRVFQLHREIATLTQGTSSISSYFTKLKDMWVEFDSLVPCPGCICPKSRKYAEHHQYQRLLQFLTGLNETYSQARSQILMMIPIPNINKTYAMLVSEESQRNLGKLGDHSDGIALFSSKGPQHGFFGSGSSGKSASAGSSGPPGPGPYGRGNYKGKNGHLFCDYCKWKGHTRETCYRLHGFPEDYKPKKKKTYSPQYSANAILDSAGSDAFTCRNSQQKDVSSLSSNHGASFSSSNHGGGMMFTQEQCDQILKMLHKEVPVDSDKNMAGSSQWNGEGDW